ncbi:MAG: SPFH domain-containing protein [Patescibacteria group bacterium]
MIETEKEKVIREKQERAAQLQRDEEDRIKEVRKKVKYATPKGMWSIPVFLVFLVFFVLALLGEFYVWASICLIPVVTSSLIIYYGARVIEENQCPMFEFWGDYKGALRSDHRLWGGLNILLPRIEKIREIPGFDYNIVHLRNLNIKLFDNKEKIEFAQTTEAGIKIAATIFVVDPYFLSYHGTDVMEQVKMLLEQAAWDVLRHIDINRLVGEASVGERENVTKQMMENLEEVQGKLSWYGISAFVFMITDVDFSQTTIGSREKLQTLAVETQSLDIELANEAKRVLVETQKALQEKQRGIGIFNRLKATRVGDKNIEPSQEDIDKAMEFEINAIKYRNGVAQMTIIETKEGNDEKTAKEGSIFGNAFFNNLPRSQKESSGKEEVTDEKVKETTKEEEK